MSAAANKNNREEPGEDKLLHSIARSLTILVKLKVMEAQGDRKDNETILMLHSMGFRPKEIADALGKTPNDVNPVISRARKSPGKRKKPARKKR